MNTLTEYNQQFQEALNKLNKVQKKAVDTIEGPVMVIAGPGTGKTQILSARIGNILLNSDTQPHNILCLTYTDAGTIAMRKRLQDFIGPDAYKVHIYTFHGFCNQVIQDNQEFFGYRGLQPISDLESIDLYHELIRNFSSDNTIKRLTGDEFFYARWLQNLYAEMKKEAWSPAYLIDLCNNYLEEIKTDEAFIYKRANGPKGIKAGDLNLNKYTPVKEAIDKTIAAAKSFDTLQQMMLRDKKYDYNDMILWVLKAFAESPTLLAKYQEKYLYFLVDEFQDTSRAQTEILNALIGYWDSPNAFVVGDDDQTIYRFQGAEVDNLKNFQDQYQEHGLVTCMMEENYRSSQPILNASGLLINQNKNRLVNLIPGLKKELIASHPEFKEVSNKPIITEYYNTTHEEVAICLDLIAKHQANQDLSEIAVIYRNHSVAANMVNYLEANNIPLNINKRVNVLDLPLIRNLLKILTYIWEEYEQPDSAEHLLFEIMHMEYFRISPRDIAIINRHNRKRENKNETWRTILASRETLFRLNLQTASAISALEENLTYWIGQIPNCTVQELFEKILTRGGLLTWTMKSGEKAWNLQVITTLFDFIKEECAKTEFRNLGQILATIQQMEKHSISLPLAKIIHNEKGINFITAHSSKGLEFKEVYLIGCNADTWDKSRSGNSFKLPKKHSGDEKAEQTEENRRLFYVAMTRAKTNLHISYSAKRADGKDISASQFIAELNNTEFTEFEKKSIPDDQVLEYQATLMMEQEKTELHFLDEEFLKAELKKYSMSVTHLNKYLDCPIRFYFENILKVPSARSESIGFGNAIHQAMEQLFVAMNSSSTKEFPPVETLLKMFDTALYQYHSHFTKDQFARKKEYGHKILPAYYNEYINTWHKNTRIEYRIINCEVDGVPINGALDKLEIEGKNVHVVDYKTGNPKNAIKKLKAPDEKEPLGGDYWRQIVFYKILLDNDRSSHFNMVSGEMNFVQPDDKDNFSRGKVVVKPEDISFVRGQIRQTYDNIMTLNFKTGCGKADCNWCNFVRTNYREVGVWSLEEEEESGE
jgi:DNA helicase-2/ATP-dependent DNA helicase PcrA